MKFAHILTIGAIYFLGAAFAQSFDPIETESKHYKVDFLTPPDGAVLEVGGMGFLSDGRMVVATRRGQVWMVENALADDPKAAKFSLFCEGLHEGLGVEIVDDQIFVLQRTELSKLVDEDKDGLCDRIETIANGWGVSGNYHEFAFGLPRDNEGNFYITLNVSFYGDKWWHGRSRVPYRGWALKISPDGKMTPVAPGFRSPAGLGRNAEGDIFVTDNQGDWMPCCPLFHLKQDRFYGHPASLNWTDDYKRRGVTATDTDAPNLTRAAPAIWLPYAWSRSAGSLVPDQTGGGFGPFEKQLFISELTNGLVMRADLEKVRGEWQGAVFMFKRNVGSAVRVLFGPDKKTLFTGLTNRGWGGQKPDDGIGRIRYTGVEPFEIKHVRLLDDGFELEFTGTLPVGFAVMPDAIKIHQYDYNYWWEYGSPECHLRAVPMTEAGVDATRTKVMFKAPKLRAGFMTRVVLTGFRSEDGRPLLHDEFNYALNQFPSGELAVDPIAKMVPQAPAKERSSEDFVYLNHGDALNLWTGSGWRAGDVKLKDGNPTIVEAVEWRERERSKDPHREAERPETLAIISGQAATPLVSKPQFGTGELNINFFLPKAGSASIWLMGRYEIRISDSGGKTKLTWQDCGGIAPCEGTVNWPGKAPIFQGFRGAGEWHFMKVYFDAPVYDDKGKKLTDACFKRIAIDDVLMHESVEVPGPTKGAPLQDEGPIGPLALGGTTGVAFQGIAYRLMGVPPDEDGWERIFNGQSIEGWKNPENGNWKVDNGVIVGRGQASHLFSPRGDYKDFEMRARVKISNGGNSGFYFRTTLGPGWPAGYEAQVNSTMTDPVKTGSLYNLNLIHGELVEPDTWFRYRVRCKDEEKGTHITIWVNDVLATDFVDQERLHKFGHIALQQHHEGSVVRWRDIEVREF